MATYAQTLVDKFRKTFKDATEQDAYDLLNQIDIEIVRKFRNRQKTIYLALEANVASVALPANAIWVRRVRFQPNTTGGYWMDVTTEDQLEVEGEPIDNDDDQPTKVYGTYDLDGGRLALVDVPTAGSLVVSNATNASPIVITTTAEHGLADGDPVSIRAVEGNEAANADGYAKVTGYSTTTFGFYSDVDLSTTIDGDGAYTEGGLVGTAANPFLEAQCAWHTFIAPAIDTSSKSTQMPDAPFFSNLYILGMCYFWCLRHHIADPRMPLYKTEWSDIMDRQDAISHRRVGHVNRKISTFHPRRGGYQVRSRPW